MTDAVPSYQQGNINKYTEYNSTTASSPSSRVKIGGVEYKYAQVFEYAEYWYFDQKLPFALYNLNGEYKTLSGKLGHVDGTPNGTTVGCNIYCDGVLVKAYTLDATTFPIDLSIDVNGVNQLKIEFVVKTNNNYSSLPAYAIGNPVLAKRATSTTSASTNTNYTGGTFIMTDVVPSYQQYHASYYKEYNSATAASSSSIVRMGGVEYKYAQVFNNPIPNPFYALFNLNSEYKTFTGKLGHVDGASNRDAVTCNIYCDTVLTKSYTLDSTTFPMDISVDVRGVKQLKIELSSRGSISTYAIGNPMLTK
ncbi:hypothetical protein FACS189490_00020 [Clostridia bacterium]|nr:hypothetical protein FACS189490_00020 [Clostridia bacterium]